MSARRRPLAGLCLLATVAAFAGCDIDTIPEGARRTPPGNGPKVVFDPAHRPLPEIPQPNDVATFPDPTSRTGRRINVSLVAPTRMERVAREGFNELEGWGTFQPLTVAFENPDPNRKDPAIALEDVAARMQGDGYDFGDDPIYLVNLTTGVPVPLEMGNGTFPLSVMDKARYWPNDLRVDQENLLLETAEEAPGFYGYRPDLDNDFDGVVDHPNTLPRPGAQAGVQVPGVDDLLTWYERETDTLIVRPLVPLEEKTEYAVVLTDRLKGKGGEAVRSPFDAIHHPTQKRPAERLRAIVDDPARRAYFGDIAGSGLGHVAFTWSFTTGPVTEDLVLLRNGLHGRGPFARFEKEFAPTATALPAVGLTRDVADDTPGWEGDPRCSRQAKRRTIVRVEEVRAAFKQAGSQLLGVDGPALDRLLQSLDNVDYFVVGTFPSPYLMGDPEHEDPDGRFRLNYLTGEGKVSRDTVPFLLSVPKKRPGHAAPFPVTVWGHGTGLHSAEIIVRAGYWARQGIAVLGMDMPGHGLYLDKGQTNLAEVAFRGSCLVPFVKSLTTGRHRDLNGDGVPDSGGWLWTAHPFHSRDNIRQSVVDMMQATRMLRGFDGVAMSTQDYDGDGAPNLAGDFDGDGTPDVGGPVVPITSSGNSLGGILAMIHGAVDTNVSATAPISGGGGLSDIAVRSTVTPDPVLGQSFSPIVVGVPATSRKDKTRCKDDEISMRFDVVDVTDQREIEIACLPPSDLSEGMTLVVSNVTNGEVRCGRAAAKGTFRVHVPSDVGDRLDVQIYRTRDAVESYGTCKVRAGADVGRRIRTFEQAALKFTPVADEGKTCAGAVDRAGLPASDTGCAQFQDRFYPVGSPLVAPQEGLGMKRQTPEFRRLIAITQAALDPGDPVNFARAYFLAPLPDLDGKPMPARGIVTFDTAGDPLVPNASGHSFARAAGAVPFLPPSALAKFPELAAYVTPDALYRALGGKTPTEALDGLHVTEGLARFQRTRSGPACKANYVSSAACTSPPSATTRCARAIADPDWLSEGKDLWDAPHPATPLRLVRKAERVSGADDAAVTAPWAARLAGPAFAPDAQAAPGAGPFVGLVTAYNDPLGQHVWINGDPCKAFDDSVYYDHLLIRFLETGGKDVYFVSHPGSHGCLEKETCDFLK